MGVVFLVFLIGILNLGLGYATAWYLGYGPANLWEAWEALTADGIAHPQTASAPATPPMDLPTLSEELALSTAEDLAEEDMATDLKVESYDEDLPDVMPTDAPENWDLSEKFVETSVLKLNVAMMKSGLRATELDTRLRACRGHNDVETIRQCLADLQEDCRTYLAEQSEAAEQFHGRIGELGELAALGDEIEMANLEQAAQIETSLSNLQHMDFESDLEAANLRLLEELKNLRMARHRLRDSQEAAFLVIANYENRLDKIEKRLYNDQLAGLRNRIGLEVTLNLWWQEGRHRTRPMSAAMFDMDGFGQVNDEHGPLVGDRILHQLGPLIEANLGKSDLAARFTGQRFLVMILDAGPRGAVRNIELLRQTIGRITFQRADAEIRVTASAGITEVTPQDTHQAVFERLEKALRQAKDAGRNRSFVHSGKEIEAVESPNLGAKYKEIRL